MKITIAGTAGRKEDAARLNSDVYEKMIEATKIAIKLIFERERVTTATLVSGGAAWADHIAVILALRHKSTFALNLHLPAVFMADGLGFVEGPDKFDAGATANYYHKAFRRASGHKSLEELGNVIDMKTTKTVCYPGFKARNLMMAESDYVIALTFGEDDVKDGGTKHMVDHFLKDHTREKLIHIPIGKL